MLRWLKRLLGLNTVELHEASPMVRNHKSANSRIVSTPYKEPPPRPVKSPPPVKRISP